MSLLEKKCVPCHSGEPPLSEPAVQKLLPQVPGWELKPGEKELRRLFTLSGYLECLAFVGAVGWMAQQENHHPDIELSYKKVLVRWTTHAVGGLSENDFICAAKTSALYPNSK
jgi:4a-hydroxytetrahydrobiopterin dehydratase